MKLICPIILFLFAPALFVVNAGSKATHCVEHVKQDATNEQWAKRLVADAAAKRACSIVDCYRNGRYDHYGRHFSGYAGKNYCAYIA
jgi:hypothetical protein